MKNIASFLDRFKNITPPERFIKEVFVRIVSEDCNIILPKDAISIKKNVLYITAHSVMKNELFLKKKILLTKLNEGLQQYKKVIKDIR